MMTFSQCRFSAPAGILAALLLAPPVPAGEAVVDYQVLISTGDPSPDGNGVFSNELGPPLLNDSSQVAFLAKLSATSDAGALDDLGLFRAGAGGIRKLARGGDTSAAGNQIDLSVLAAVTPLIQPFFSAPVNSLYALDKQGRLAFVAVDDRNEDAIYRADGDSLQVIIQSGQSTSFASDVNIGQAAVSFLGNDEGQIAFRLIADNRVYQVLNAGANSDAQLVSDQPLDDGRTLASFRSYALNNNGATVQRLNTSNNTFGYYLSDSQDTSKILHVGEAAPDGRGSFTIDTRVAPNINDRGQVVVQMFVDDAVRDYIGTFFYDGAQLNELRRTGVGVGVGVSAVDGDAELIISAPRLNNNGTLAYLTTTEAPLRLQSLTLHQRGAETTLLTQGDMLPAPLDLALDELRGVALNEQDQLLFRARLRGGGVPREALLFYDQRVGVVPVVVDGQAFRGSTVRSFTAALPFTGLEANANWKNAENSFNNSGLAAFTYLLENGEAGVAVAEVQFAAKDEIFSDHFESR